MNGFAERVLELRKSEGLSQADFAKALNLSQNFVWMVEKGQRFPSDRTISDICRVFNVQEDWLRHGLEPMRAERSREEVVAEMVGRALSGDNEFQQAVIKMICSRTDDELAVLEAALRQIYADLSK